MANPAHLEKLCEGPKAWNAWREANPNIVPDLGEIQLTLHQRQLGPSNGGPIDFHAADLENAVLRYATLSGADLEGTRLVGADLTHARLDGARLMGADLTDALLDQADLTGALMDQTVLFGTDLSDTRNLTMAQLEQAFGDASTKLPGNLLPPDKWFPAPEDDDDDYAGWGMAAMEEPAEQSLYETLGLTPQAESDEIRAAYRVLVKKLHPDINPNDEQAQDRFKRVTIAYRILNDAEQRARYDRGEIDGDGRADPEFEARRRFRHTAYRYYAAAAGSFALALCVLAGVWYTVLSVSPEDEAEPQVAVISEPAYPKRSGRLGDEPRPTQMKPVMPEKNLALATTEDAATDRPQTPPPAEGDAQGSRSAPAAAAKPQPALGQPVLPPPAHEPLAASDAPPPELFAGGSGAGGPAQQNQLTRQPDQTAIQRTPDKADAVAQRSGGAPATPSESAKVAIADAQQQAAASAQVEQAGPPPAPAVQPAPQPPVSQPAQTAPQMGGAPSPLSEGHKGAAGQIKPSAPEGGSVAALPSAGQPQMATDRDRQIQGGASVGGPRIEKSDLPQSARRKAARRQLAQQPAGRDVVSKVLRTRAIWQALGARKRPLVAIEGIARAERRAGLYPDFPTNALPGKRQAAPFKQTVGNQPRKSLEGRQAIDPQQAAGIAAPAAAESNKREIRQQQQAVSDILAGGL